MSWAKAVTSTPLVYIGGSGRSGSTLLDRMLACIPGFCSVGELEWIWRRCLQRDDRCGCGSRFSDCRFWTSVGEVGFGGWGQVDVDEVVRLSAAVDRHRNIARIGGLHRPGKLAGSLNAYHELTSRLYQAVRDVSGGAVIVDSSKNLSYALVLRDLPGFDFRLVHLVRRSHGVAHSWSRRVLKPAVGDGSEYMSVHPPMWSVGLWMVDNLLYEILGRRIEKATLIRYEDLVADPQAELGRLVGSLDLPGTDLTLDFLADSSADLPFAHAVSGNPMRFRQGQILLRADDEWQTSMSRHRQAAITAVTWPLLRRYGYPIATRADHQS
jgi:hypothetical protein